MNQSTVLTQPALTDVQTAAMRAFVRKCGQAMLSLVVLVAIGMLIVIAANPLNPNNGPVLIALFALIGLYPLVLLVVIWLRTRLGWHLLNAHALWVGIIGALIVIALTVVARVISMMLQSEVIEGFPANSITVLLLILPIFFAPAFRSSTRSRAEQERARFADHWLKLGSLPFWRVFLLIIPHERA